MATTFQSSIHAVLVLLLTFHIAYAYIPAHPTNDTAAIQNSRMNTTQASKLHLQWYSNGAYWEDVSHQLVGTNSKEISQGALVHFSESHAGNLTSPSATPWIALVSCDFNATNSSQVQDIFTLARNKGAVSALLFTLFSQTCVINPQYAKSAATGSLDIFSTPSQTTAHIIEYLLGVSNASIYSNFDSQLLNQSLTMVNDSINAGNPVAPGYVIATLLAFDINATAVSSSGSGGRHANIAIAMTVFYTIMGCVLAFF